MIAFQTICRINFIIFFIFCVANNMALGYAILEISSWTHRQIRSSRYFAPPRGGVTHTRVSQYQKGKTNLDFTEARNSVWQWHQLGRVQVSTLLQTDNHASTPPVSFYRPDSLPAAQLTASKH